MLKIFGIVIVLGALLVTLVGVGGAVMNFVFPPKEYSCEHVDEYLKKADEAAKAYEKAKDTPDEYTARADAERAIKEAQSWNESCGRAKDSHRFYGFIFAGVGFVGFIGVLLGGGLTLLGFWKRKKTA